jgi:hypothetical protein
METIPNLLFGCKCHCLMEFNLVAKANSCLDIPSIRLELAASSSFPVSTSRRPWGGGGGLAGASTSHRESQGGAVWRGVALRRGREAEQGRPPARGSHGGAARRDLQRRQGRVRVALALRRGSAGRGGAVWPSGEGAKKRSEVGLRRGWAVRLGPLVR